MKVGGQLHVPAALPQESALSASEEKVHLALQLVCNMVAKRKFPAHARNQTLLVQSLANTTDCYHNYQTLD
jgi:hypothetical protein